MGSLLADMHISIMHHIQSSTPIRTIENETISCCKQSALTDAISDFESHIMHKS